MQKQFSKVVIMGMGYIGLPTAALIASNNIKVIGVDVDANIISTINKGKIHIIEPDLEGLVKSVIDRGFLKATVHPTEADVFIITVPTPITKNKKPDISYIETATKAIIPFLKQGNLFIIESTSPVGTTEKITEIIFNKRPELKNNLYIAYCPERVLPGNIIYELQHNDRVIGGIDEKSTTKAIEFYNCFIKAQLHRTTVRTAEMCKLVENSYRDVNIAFANELSMISDKAGINVWNLIKLANKHPRVNILQPGTGVGGHCIAVDPWFIVSKFKNEAKIIKKAREINDYKSQWVIEKITNEILKFELKNKRKPVVACMGITFKPGIDDLRESPALFVTRQLLKTNNADFLVVEPNISHPPAKTQWRAGNQSFKLINYNKACEKADIIVFLVAHKQFKTLEIKQDKIVLNFCGI